MIKKIVIIGLFTLIIGCGYQPIFNDQTDKFSIKTITSNNENTIFFKIKNNLKRYIDDQNNTNTYDLIISSNSNILTKSKDKKGNPQTYEIVVVVKVDVYKKQTSFSGREFKEIFSYPRNENKYNQKQYEKSLISDLTDKIIQDINSYLIAISQ
ncbi:MAG: hypothetical protein CBE06_001630 [Pelagibacteraceae bacterium TMED246]|nr:MAG: hypothetical protein CBE06_001630 [Pelagibacteraceae bacterium TMED246]|tara:strand:+ start:11665 stop:12126 length:462 start_codon:yes stop_codon:yes gene_type:complete